MASSAHGRRPSINSIHPFKSATVSSSPSSASFRSPGMAQARAASSASPFTPTHSTNPSTTSFTSIGDQRLSTAPSDRGSNTQSSTSTAILPMPRSPERPPLQLSSTRYSSSFGNRPGSVASVGGFIGGSSASGDTGGLGHARGLSQPTSLGREAPIRRIANTSNEVSCHRVIAC